MPFTLSYVCQGQQRERVVNETGDYNSLEETLSFGATRVTNQGVVPEDVVELIVDTDIACTIDCGSNSALTIAAGKICHWSLSSGITSPLAGSTLTAFTIVSTESEGSGDVRIAWKTNNS